MSKKTWRIVWTTDNADGSIRVRYANNVKYASREAAERDLHELQDDPLNAWENFYIEEPFDSNEFFNAFFNAYGRS